MKKKMENGQTSQQENEKCRKIKEKETEGQNED